MRGCVVDEIIRVKFYRNRLRGFRAVEGRTWGLPLTLTVALTTGQPHRAACDKLLAATRSDGDRPYKGVAREMSSKFLTFHPVKFPGGTALEPGSRQI